MPGKKSMGQVFTPAPIADLALKLAKVGPTGKVLDPTCGDGAFLRALIRKGIEPSRLYGFELDPHLADDARSTGANIRTTDLFAVTDGDGEYDCVVGNPPYVRAREQSDETKALVQKFLLGIGIKHAKLDLALASILKSLTLVRPGGRVVFVLSQALLFATYTSKLWSELTDRAQVLGVVHEPGAKWFPNADIKACILVLRRKDTGSSDTPTKVVELTANGKRTRKVPSATPESLREAMRAPSCWWSYKKIPTVRLGDVATLARGLTSGHNGTFYLPVGHGICEESVSKLYKSKPRACTGLAIAPDELVDLLSNPMASDSGRAYIESLEGGAIAGRLSKARSPWWKLPRVPVTGIAIPRAYGDRFLVRYTTSPVAVDQRVVAVYPKSGTPWWSLVAVLNSTYTALAMEVCGRASGSGGVLELSVGDLRNLPIIDPRTVDTDAARACLTAIGTRPIDRISVETLSLDRRALDVAVHEATDLLACIYDELPATVSSRTVKHKVVSS